MFKYYQLLLCFVLSVLYSSNALGFDVGVVNSNMAGTIDCPGSFSNLSADVKNYGTQQVDSFYVYVDINGAIFDTLLVFQSIGAGQQINTILGNYNLSDSLNNAITLSTGLPNGNIDINTTNDSFTFNTHARLSGSYTVGCLSCHFPNLAGVVSYLSTYGVCGPTTFDIVDGVYNTGQLNIGPFTGMSSANPVVFQSMSQDSTAVSLVPSVSPSIVLNSIQHVTFRKLTLAPQAGNIGFKLSSVSNFTIENCLLNTAQIQTASSGGGSNFDSVRVSNNLIFNGSISFTNNGANPSNSNGFVEISNNDFIDSYAKFNKFAHVEFTGNEINSPSIDNPIHFIACQNATISKNFMSHANEGLLLSNVCSMIDITNNFFRGDGKVIEINSSNNISIINNSLFQYDASNDNGEALNETSSTNIEFINNILYSEEYGSLVKCSDTAAWNPHHNIYYSPSDSLLQFVSDHFTYQDWTVNYGKDSNSWNYDPHYISSTDLHVNNLIIAEGNGHLYPGITEDFDGDLRNPLEFDIGADEFDLDYSTLRDIALISINEPHADSCLQADSMLILVANYSAFQIDSFAVQRDFYGSYVDVVWNYTPLPAGDTVLVNIGAFHFSPNTSYDIDLILDFPNGQPDNYELNNNANVLYQFLDAPKISVREVSDCSPLVELTVPNHIYNTLLWSTNEITDKITVSPPGAWSVTVTNQSGCVVSKTITLN